LPEPEPFINLFCSANAGLRTDYWNWGTGFISAYPPDQFLMLENGAKYGGQKNQIWAPYYTLHKILAGLMDVYEMSGNKKALAVAAGMGDLVYARLSKVSPVLKERFPPGRKTNSWIN
jgi:hypothetical protein